MTSSVLQFALLLVVLVHHTRLGEASVFCYSDSGCDEGSLIETSENAQACCMLSNGLSYDSGEPCAECLVYGWTDDFPIEVTKGQVLELNIGYLKGSANIRRGFDIIYNDSQVEVNDDDDYIILEVSELLQVEILDDGKPVTEDIVITITLSLRGPPPPSIDTVHSVATLIIPAPEVTVSLEDSLILVNESDGSVSVCVSATGINTPDSGFNVSLSAISDTAVDGVDYQFPYPSELELSYNSSRACVDVLLVTDNLYEYTESFFVQLNTYADDVQITQNMTNITILDTDEAIMILDKVEELVVEGDHGVKSVCLSLLNSAVPVSVTFDEQPNMDDVTIIDFEEFQLLSPDGTPTCYSYIVIDDNVTEDTEFVIASFRGLGPRITPVTFTLIIVDDDDTLPTTTYFSTPSPSLQPSPSPTGVSSSIPPSTSSISPTPSPTILPIPQDIADTISGGALIATLINARSTGMDLPNEVSLCYEIHGEPGKYFNFISESCLSVNAHYLEYDPIKPLNFIDQIAIVATNSDGYNTNMTIDRHCNLYIDGPRRFFNYSGIMAEAAPGHVVVVIDNSYCGGEEIVLVVECTPDQHGLIQLHVTRDPAVQNGKLSHGLLGQFWSVPISIEHYGEDPDDYLVDMHFSGSSDRQIVGSMGSVTWELQRRKCLYIGDRQGSRGAGLHSGPNDPVIEGVYSDYIMDGPFDTSFEFALFGDWFGR